MTFKFALKKLVLFWGVFLAQQAVNAYEVSVQNNYLELDLAQLREVEIATGTPVELYKAPAVTTLITQEQLQYLAVDSVEEALATIAGIHLYPSPFNLLNYSFSIRGIYTDQNPQVLFLVNGLPLRAEYTGSRPQRMQIPIHSVARIEVIRGPGSAVYGADAYAGVVNVITKSAKDTQGANIGLGIGSFNTKNVWANIGTQLGDWHLGMLIEYQQSRGDDERIFKRDLQSVFDQLLMSSASEADGSASLNTNYDIFDARLMAENENLKAQLWYWRNKDAGVGAGAAQALDKDGTQNTALTQFDIEYEDSFGDWLTTLRYQFFDLEDRRAFSVFPAGAFLPIGLDGNLNTLVPAGFAFFSDGYLGNPQPDETLHAVELSGNYQFNKHKLRIAIGYSHRKLSAKEQKNFGPGVIDVEDILAHASPFNPLIVGSTLTDVSNSDNAFVENVSRKVKFLSVQDQWQLTKNLEFTAGVRHDSYSDFGDTTNPRLALVWQTAQNVTTKLMYGSAFRAPAFDSLYAKNNPAGLGNPKLLPETIDTTELSVIFQLSPHAVISSNFYYYQAKDLIEFRPDQSGTVSIATNARGQKGKGLELEFSYQTEKHKFTANYAWQDSEDSSSKVETPLTPKHLFYTDYRYQLNERISVVTKAKFVGDRKRELLDPRAPLGDYTLFDLALYWQPNFANGWQVNMTINNVFDKNYEEPSRLLGLQDFGPISDYTMEGRSLLFSLAKRF